jgi:hypothetical protein
MAQDTPRAAVPEIVTDRAAPLTAAETAGSPGAPAAADRRWFNHSRAQPRPAECSPSRESPAQNPVSARR